MMEKITRKISSSLSKITLVTRKGIVSLMISLGTHLVLMVSSRIMTMAMEAIRKGILMWILSGSRNLLP